MDRMDIDIDSFVVKAEGSLVSDMDGDKVMLSMKTGKYYNLGRVGGRIWELLEKPRTVREMTGILIGEYNVDAGECERQVLVFIKQLLHEQLIAHAPEPVSSHKLE